jgi:hypothetical protein
MPPSQSDSAYEILGVPRDADGNALRRAIRGLALKHHPDAVPADEKPEAGLRFARINQAYELLRDPERRHRYDDLLARGVTPDLSQQAGVGPGLPSLAEILGEIHSLDMDVDLREQTRAISSDLALPLLQSLVKTGNFRETVYDTLRVSRLVRAQNFDRPRGSLNEAWVIVTDLRLMVLMLFVRRYSKGKSQVVERSVRGRSFPYLSLKEMAVKEVGRVFPSYRLELTDQDGDSFTLKLRKPRLPGCSSWPTLTACPSRRAARGARSASTSAPSSSASFPCSCGWSRSSAQQGGAWPTSCSPPMPGRRWH